MDSDDISKIILICDDGKYLYDRLLDEYKVQLEMASFKYVIAMTSVAVFLYENEDGTYKGSLRVNGDYDVAKVASVFGGGGHVKAAGFTIDGPLDVAVDRILTAIKDNI